MVTTIKEKIKETKKDVLWYLRKDKKYFMRQYFIAKPLLNEAKEIASNIRSSISGKKNLKDLKLMLSQLKKLQNRQRWQQLRSRYPKLREAMMKLLSLPTIKEDTKNRIINLMKKESIFEGDSLKITAEELYPEFRRKKLHEINWGKMIDIITKLITDIRSLTLIITELKKAVEKA